MFSRSSYLDEILSYVGNDEIKVLSGVKGSGKHTLIRKVIQHMKDDG